MEMLVLLLIGWYCGSQLIGFLVELMDMAVFVVLFGVLGLLLGLVFF